MSEVSTLDLSNTKGLRNMKEYKNLVFVLIVIFSLMMILNGCSDNADNEIKNETKNVTDCGECQFFDGEKCTNYQCCNDSDCLDPEICRNNLCVEIDCDCGYILNGNCVSYECCKNTDCQNNEICQDNKCTKLDCGYCTYPDRHKCRPYECCKDSDCDDKNASTRDYCENPTKTNAKCIHEIICKSDSDCNDKNDCTIDKCVKTKCQYSPVTKCTNDDGCCPEGCIFQNDNDCPKKDLCSKDSDCEDNDNSTKNQCLGTPKVCVFTKITECIDDDNYCPKGCNYDNDSDCVDTRSNLNVSGPISVLSFCRGSQGKLCIPDCQSQQVVTFFVESTFTKDQEVMFEYYIDGVVQSDPILLNVIDNQSYTSTKIKKGINQVFFKIDEQLSGKNISIILDPLARINESKKDNQLNKTFEKFSSDLKVESAYIDFENQIYINLSRTNITLQCLPIENKVYLNNVSWPFIFSGFEGKSAYIKSPLPATGNHSLRIEIDLTGKVEDPNKANNVLEKTIEILE